MLDAFTRLFTRWFRIPPDPQPPRGSAESVQVFRASRNYFKLALVRWGFRQLGTLIGIVLALSLGQAFLGGDLELARSDVDEALERIPLAPWAQRLLAITIEPVAGEPDQVVVSFGPLLFWLELIGIGFFVLQLPLSYMMVRLDYALRWYIVTDCSLRIREGVLSIHEATMTFANIQNVAVQQGPVQRLFGIADLKVRTAGGGGSAGEDGDDGASKKMHIGFFRGVDNATEIRDTIVQTMKTATDAGLGEAGPSKQSDGAASAVAAARRVLEEARAMRSVLAGGS